MNVRLFMAVTKAQRLPNVMYKGPGESDRERFLTLANKLERGEAIGQNSQNALAELIRRDVELVDLLTGWCHQPLSEEDKKN